MALSGTRSEDTAGVVFRYCPAGLLCQSEIAVYKTTPASYRITPCAHAEGSTTWESLVASVDALQDVLWSTG